MSEPIPLPPGDDGDRWQETNEQHLAASLAWLRLRLERLASARTGLPIAAEPAPTPIPTVAPEREEWWQRWMWWRDRPGAPTTGPLPPASAPPRRTGDAELERAEWAMRQAAAAAPPPQLVLLGQRLGLTAFEREIVLLCTAMELDPAMAALVARAQPDLGTSAPTFALALNLFPDRSWDALLPRGPLRYWGLIEINQPAGQPLTTSPLRADERIVNYLKGLNELDDRFDPLLSPSGPAADDDLPPSQAETVELIARRWESSAAGDRRRVANLLGPDLSSKELVARQAAARQGRLLYRISAELLAGQAGEVETLARLWGRESALLPIALFVDAQEVETGPAGTSALAITRFLSRGGGLFFLASRERWPGLSDAFTVEVARPAAAEQRDAWLAALGPGSETIADALAGQFSLNLGAIRDLARPEAPLAGGDVDAARARLWAASRDASSPRMDGLAQRIEGGATWDDLILPSAEKALLRQIADQVGQRSTVYERFGFGAKLTRGRGISALFAGHSGTGKTMAAEVMAAALGLNLYRIDLSAVVSKYVGETEANLRRLFDAAEEGAAILFFDEADALFGKRSEVKDSHDRYANIEINYLLQRMEAYRGLAILATNMRSALDQAFLRRLRFIVEFPFPGAAERRAIWERVFPRETPLAALDFDRLAKLPTTGGMIHNIAINAAFVAAHRGAAVSMPIVLDAARTEFRKIDVPIPERELAWLEPLAVPA